MGNARVSLISRTRSQLRIQLTQSRSQIAHDAEREVRKLFWRRLDLSDFVGIFRAVRTHINECGKGIAVFERYYRAIEIVATFLRVSNALPRTLENIHGSFVGQIGGNS